MERGNVEVFGPNREQGLALLKDVDVALSPAVPVARGGVDILPVDVDNAGVVFVCCSKTAPEGSLQVAESAICNSSLQNIVGCIFNALCSRNCVRGGGGVWQTRTRPGGKWVLGS